MWRRFAGWRRRLNGGWLRLLRGVDETTLRSARAALEPSGCGALGQALWAQVRSVGGVTAEVYVPAVANHVPHLRIEWDQAVVKIKPAEVARRLREVLRGAA